MSQSKANFKPLLRAKLFRLAFFCALIPAALVFIAAMLPETGAGLAGAGIASQVKESTETQLAVDAQAQAQRISARLDKVGLSVLMLRDYAREVLSSPGAYAAPWKPAAPPAAPATPKPDAPGETPVSGDDKAVVNITPKAVEKNLFYTVSPDGALRKVLGQGSAVFYRRPDAAGGFSEQAMQKLYASTSLDPLLQSLAKSDPLASQMYFVTEDGLLRTYPFLDTAAWPADKDLTQISMYAWSADKANAQGLVWTTPYVSHLSGKWVVACTASVQLGDHQSAIAGCEIDLSKFTDELLAFSLGNDFYSWIFRPDGLVLGAQSKVFEEVGTRAIGLAALPDETTSAEKILEASNIFSTGFSDIGGKLKDDSGEILHGTALELDARGQYLVCEPIPASGWLLAGVVTNPVIQALEQQSKAAATSRARRLNYSLLALILGLGTVLVITWIDSRRLVTPIRILTEQVERSARNGGANPVAIADEGEIGRLAHAIQRLVDVSQGEKPAESAEPLEEPAAPPDTRPLPGGGEDPN